MTASYVDLDVRPILRAKGEPFQKIMETVAALAPGQGLRLLATFKPVPLLQVLASQGFSNETRELPGGDWEVLFSPAGAEKPADRPGPAAGADDTTWPEPIRFLDNRDLDPPEPMVRILAEAEAMNGGEVLCALLCREPMFLFPELAKRGHRWRGGFDPDGTTYRIFIHVGGSDECRTPPH